jgi:hypothetical protein
MFSSVCNSNQIKALNSACVLSYSSSFIFCDAFFICNLEQREKQETQKESSFFALRVIDNDQCLRTTDTGDGSASRAGAELAERKKLSVAFYLAVSSFRSREARARWMVSIGSPDKKILDTRRM